MDYTVDTIGYAPGFPMLREMAEEVCRQRIKTINDDGVEHISYTCNGKTGG